MYDRGYGGVLIQMRYKIKEYLKYYWTIWAKALGKKAHENDHYADRIAVVRTVIVLVYLITNFFIIAGVIRHW
jgi:hypothetical protein